MTVAEELLNDLRAFIVRYVWFPSEHHAAVVALWIAHTWTVTAFYTTPRLILDSAEPGSGKTRVLELLALLCQRAKLTLSTTTAALYRRIAAASDEDLAPPTILQDESDAVFGKMTSPQTEELRALYNSGYKRGATVDRCEGDAKKMRVREFPVFAPVALAGLAGKMPDTITSRAVTLHMRRRRPADSVAEYRERDAKLHATPLCDRLELWATQATNVLAELRPAMPDGVADRPAEVWEPLLAIAEHAGGHWPDTARAACRYFVVESASEDEKLSLGVRLLRDIKTVFETKNTAAMWTNDLLNELKRDDESEWRDLWGKPLDARRLAKELKRYGIQSAKIREGIATANGYKVDGPSGLAQAWQHWLPTAVSGTSGTSGTHAADQGKECSGNVPDQSGTGTQRNALTSNVPVVPDVPDKSRPELSSRWKLCRHCGETLQYDDDKRTGWHSDKTACVKAQQTNQRAQLTVVGGGQTPRTYSKSDGKLSCRDWLSRRLGDLVASGVPYLESNVAYADAAAEGYSKTNMANAVYVLKLAGRIRTAGKTGRTERWCIDPAIEVTYRTVEQTVDDYLDALASDVPVVDPDHFYAAMARADIDRDTARKTMTRSNRIQIEQISGTEWNWRIVRADGESA